MRAIHGSGLGKSYHYHEVIRGVSFEISQGECYALLGPNGAGKTTLLRVLATIQPPSSGRFEIMGYDGVKHKDRVREQLLLLGHSSYLYDDLNAEENLRFSLALRGSGVGDREMKLALDRVGIGAFSQLRTRYFSMGMKKRLSIAKAILIRPNVILLDEPYASLDESGMKMVNHYIRETTQQGAAVLLTTHDRLRSAQVAHRAGILDRGTLKEVDVKHLAEPNEIF